MFACMRHAVTKSRHFSPPFQTEQRAIQYLSAMTDKCAVAGCWTAAIPEQTRSSGASIATNSHPRPSPNQSLKLGGSTKPDIRSVGTAGFARLFARRTGPQAELHTQPMSAFGGKADIPSTGHDVRY